MHFPLNLYLYGTFHIKTNPLLQNDLTSKKCSSHNLGIVTCAGEGSRAFNSMTEYCEFECKPQCLQKYGGMQTKGN